MNNYLKIGENMKRVTIISISLLMISSLQAQELNSKQEGLKYIKMLGKELKSNLKAHMKSDKTGLSAMAFCSQKASEIEQEVNAKLPKGVSVRRTALKIRNQKNKPDAIDLKILNYYSKKAEEKKLSPKDIEVVDTNSSTRVYKPLLIKPVCLKCHGDINKISDDIKTVLNKTYPQDKATGFKEGDLRGVIVSEIKK